MRTKVTAEGLLIPKGLLEGLDEVEIRRENGFVLILPASDDASTQDADFSPIPDDDPIYQFGKDPIDVGITDAASNHDRYIYP